MESPIYPRKRVKIDGESESERNETFLPLSLFRSVLEESAEDILLFEIEESSQDAKFKLLASKLEKMQTENSFFLSHFLLFEEKNVGKEWSESIANLSDSLSNSEMIEFQKLEKENFEDRSLLFPPDSSPMVLNSPLISMTKNSILCILSLVYHFKSSKGTKKFRIEGKGKEIVHERDEIHISFKGMKIESGYFVSLHIKHIELSRNGFSSRSTASHSLKAKSKKGEKERLRTFFDAAPLWIAVSEIVDEKTLIYHDLNFAFANVLTKGKNPDPVGYCLGKTSRELGLEDVQIKFWVDNMKLAKGKHPVNFEIVDPLISKTFFCICKHLEDNTYVCITSDVTEKKLMEDELRRGKEILELTVKERTKELEEALAVKSRFLATMSHEIRTPLSGIVGGLSFLAQSDLTTEGREMIRIGQICSDQLLMVINDVLDLSKIEANQMILDNHPLRFKSILEESIEISSFESNKKNIPLILRSELPPNLVVEVDRGRIRQIILNLLSNSIKFTEEGEIVLSVKCLETPQTSLVNNDINSLKEQEKKEENRKVTLEVCVRDTGIGINESFKNRIFSPFSQGDSSITRRYGGSGLGLSICKRLVEMMGGKMWLESKVGEGSAFYFTIHVNKAEKGLPEEEEQQVILQRIREEIALINIRPKTIVIVETNQTQLNDFVYNLTNLHFRCLTFPSCQHLLSDPTFQSREMNLEAVLLDGQDNPEDIKMVINFLKKQGCTSRKVIVTVTSLVSDPELKEMKEGMLTLRKPIRNQQLLLLLDRLFLDLKYSSSSAVMTGNSNKRNSSIENLRVLVAEDNVLNQKIIQKILKSFGIDAKMVDNGKKALEILENETFDVILMDCMMPIMGGIEATKLIRANVERKRQPKIFALTADVFTENAKMCLEAGMDSVLTKPINSKDLKELLSQVDTFNNPSE